MPAGLRRAYLLVLAPAALLAPLPLLWTQGASRSAVLLFELALLFLWARARAGRPVRVSDAMLNLAGLAYLAWLAFETATLRLGLLRSVSHLLLFTALAKLASLKRPSEARLALLVVFLMTLASASSATHVSSLVYFAVMALVGFRTLGLLAVLADFDDAPPDRVLKAVPTAGLAAAALAAGAALTAPLFFALPRLHGPFAVAPFRIEDALSKTLTSDRVDLQGFGAAKRSDRVILRLTSEPELARGSALRLREAVFTNYQDGSWLRDPRFGLRRGERSVYPGSAPGNESVAAVVSVDLNVFGQGFLFLPYGTSSVHIEKGHAIEMSDGVMHASSGRGPVHYEAEVRRRPVRGPGRAVISPADVPEEIQEFAIRLTANLTDPRAIYKAIEDLFLKDFVYTLDPPRATGDPLVDFLLRSKAGHCEYFASAAAMMLTARGVPARLVTGSYGGEAGLFSRSIVVRADNLHAWVEADLDGTGFQVLDPTPPSGVPPAFRPFSLLSRLAALGREFEFFYDRRILGFDAGDQAGAVEAVRESLASAARSLEALKTSARDLLSAGTVVGGLAAALLGWLVIRTFARWRAAFSPATRAYLALRRLLSRRKGLVAPSVPPEEVARLFAEVVPEGRDDARAVVSIYCASAFGGIEPGPEAVRELQARLRRLRKLA
ncbi:MAG TPA: transglutaminaseTgpA domain-containing protein [Thermoanaerobaculia bacterium]